MRTHLPGDLAAPGHRWGTDPDKPTVTFAPPSDLDLVSHAMTIWVPDCQAAHAVLSPRRAVFLTPPVAWSGEIRAFLRDPGGHPLEISQVR